MWWKKNKWKVITPVIVAAVLAFAFWYGGSAPGLRGWTAGGGGESLSSPPPVTASPLPGMPLPADTPAVVTPPGDSAEPEAPSSPEPAPESPEQEPVEGIESRPGGLEGGMSASDKIEAAIELSGGSSPGAEAGDEEYSQAQGMVIDPATGKDKYLTAPVPEGRPLPVEPQDVTVSDTVYTCTLSISCATILDNMAWLDPEKAELVPPDGWILPATQVSFYEGESVFNVLQRTCKQLGIHMEFTNTPIYNSAYIEGVGNLYEFDCGELSGWMYKVNDWFPNYGCSRYQLRDGDVICWEYTCDLGVDIGGFNAIGG